MILTPNIEKFMRSTEFSRILKNIEKFSRYTCYRYLSIYYFAPYFSPKLSALGACFLCPIMQPTFQEYSRIFYINDTNVK